MCCIGGGEVVGFHLAFEDRGRGIDEEGWVADTSAAPYDVERGAIVKSCGFGDYAGRFYRIREVGGDGVEALGLRIQSALLVARFSYWSLAGESQARTAM